MKHIKFTILIATIFLHMFGIIKFTTGCFPWQACKPSIYQFGLEQEEI
jgi:hypothetical protein